MTDAGLIGGGRAPGAAAAGAGAAVIDRVDPEIRSGLDAFLAAVGPGGLEGIADLGERRRTYDELVARRRATYVPEDLVIADHAVASAGDGGALRVRSYRPQGLQTGGPAVLYLHGGGFALGSRDADDLIAGPMAQHLGCTVVAVDYRLAPEHPHPAPVDDCLLALEWLGTHGAEIGVDPARVALYGASAGGGLAAATALLARDCGVAPPVIQVLANPMLDDRNVTPSSYEVVDLGAWDRDANVRAWRQLLGPRAGGDDVSPYAAPARADDLTGLPPAYVDVGQLDVFRDECLDYAARLMRAGVAVELHVLPGVVHGSEFLAPDAAASRRLVAGRLGALRRALGLSAPPDPAAPSHPDAKDDQHG